MEWWRHDLSVYRASQKLWDPCLISFSCSTRRIATKEGRRRRSVRRCILAIFSPSSAVRLDLAASISFVLFSIIIFSAFFSIRIVFVFIMKNIRSLEKNVRRCRQSDHVTRGRNRRRKKGKRKKKEVKFSLIDIFFSARLYYLSFTTTSSSHFQGLKKRINKYIFFFLGYPLEMVSVLWGSLVDQWSVG